MPCTGWRQRGQRFDRWRTSVAHSLQTEKCRQGSSTVSRAAEMQMAQSRLSEGASSSPNKRCVDSRDDLTRTACSTIVADEEDADRLALVTSTRHLVGRGVGGVGVGVAAAAAAAAAAVVVVVVGVGVEREWEWGGGAVGMRVSEARSSIARARAATAPSVLPFLSGCAIGPLPSSSCRNGQFVPFKHPEGVAKNKHGSSVGVTLALPPPPPTCLNGQASPLLHPPGVPKKLHVMNVHSEIG